MQIHNMLVATFLIPVLLLGVIPLVAQEGGEPKQWDRHLDPKKKVHQSSDEPRFAFQIPKKLRGKWKFADLDARRDDRVNELEGMMEKAENDAEKQKYQDQIDRLNKNRELIRMRLEVEADENTDLEYIEVFFNDTATTETIENVGKGLVKWLKENYTIHGKAELARDITSGRDKKNERYVYRYQAVGTPKNGGNKRWMRYQSYLVYNKKRSNRFRVMFVHQIPASKLSDKDAKKDALKEAEKLLKGFRI
jgi:hypothetical protein